MVSIVKSTTQPSDKESLWIDLSTKPFKIKVFGPDGWTPISVESSGELGELKFQYIQDVPDIIIEDQ